MKRLATLFGLAFAALVGSFAMSAPAHASTLATAGNSLTPAGGMKIPPAFITFYRLPILVIKEKPAI